MSDAKGQMKTPLLGAQQAPGVAATPVAGLDETKHPGHAAAPPVPAGPVAATAPPAKPKPAQGPYEKAAPAIFRRAFILLFGLLLCQYTATTIYCRGFAWIVYAFTCQPEWSLDKEGGFSLNTSGHPLCYRRCTPLNMSTILDVFISNVSLFMLWWIGEFLLVKFDLELKAEIKGGYDWQGERDAEMERQGIPTFKQRQTVVRHSPEWNDQLKGWQERKGAQKKVFGKGNRGRAYTFYFLYYVIASGNMWLCMTVSPQHYETPDNYGTLEYVGDLVRNFGKIRFDGFYDGLIISVVVLETILFFMAALSVQWPKPALIRKSDLSHRPKEFFKDSTKTVSLLEDEQAGLINDTCLLIACHESCLTKERTETFSATLRSAMEVFPPRAIFVCDNGNARHPVDRTLQVCKALSKEKSPDGTEEINYLYIPEGNKTHAMYWSTEYWIPELVRRGEIKDYTYAMIIDDDVPVPPDLHVPNNMLNRNTRIKAIAYVIQAATEDGSVNQLVQLQDLEYKMAGLVKQFQLKMGTTACCHGAIALWRRDVLGRRILWDHDTVFHGEDLYMGLLLHRMGMGYKIGVSAGAVVPTFAPEKLLILFRQRVKSWDLCAQRKFMTFVKELFRWGGTTTLGLKPFMFQEVINILLDWMRLYLVFGLAHRNPVSLILCFFIFYGLLYIEILMFNYLVLRSRPDLQVTGKTLFLFPFYRTLCLAFRLYALVENIIRYSSWRPKNVRISERESTIQDMPPVPPDANPDWWTIWHVNQHQEDTHAELKGFTEKLMGVLNIESRPEKRRMTNVVQAYLLYKKLLEEDAQCNFPLVLRDVFRNKADDTAKTTELLIKAMETMRKTFILKLEQLISDDWEDFQHYVDQTLEKWNEAPNNLFLAPQLMEPTVENAKMILEGNLHVMQSISQLIYLTNYPQNHDKVAELKVNIKDLIGLLEIQIQSDRRRQNTAVVLNHILSSLEQVKQVIITRQVVYFPWSQEELCKILTKIETLRLDDAWRQNILRLCDQYKSDMARIQAETGSQESVSPSAPPLDGFPEQKADPDGPPLD